MPWFCRSTGVLAQTDGTPEAVVGADGMDSVVTGLHTINGVGAWTLVASSSKSFGQLNTYGQTLFPWTLPADVPIPHRVGVSTGITAWGNVNRTFTSAPMTDARLVAGTHNFSLFTWTDSEEEVFTDYHYGNGKAFAPDALIASAAPAAIGSVFGTIGALGRRLVT